MEKRAPIGLKKTLKINNFVNVKAKLKNHEKIKSKAGICVHASFY